MIRLPVKPEGHPYPQAPEWTPKHPAKWCKLRYLWTVLTMGNFYGPYGRVWSFEGHDWTCYIRFRLYSMGWKFALRHPFDLWEHMHRDFRDPFWITQQVENGGIDDPYIHRKFVGHWETVEPRQ